MTKTKKPMSDAEYVMRCGQVCPFCGSEDISTVAPMEYDYDAAWQEVQCANPECEGTWRDLYKLTGYEDLRGE